MYESCMYVRKYVGTFKRVSYVGTVCMYVSLIFLLRVGVVRSVEWMIGMSYRCLIWQDGGGDWRGYRLWGDLTV